jgi:hypothetical protein
MPGQVAKFARCSAVFVCLTLVCCAPGDAAAQSLGLVEFFSAGKARRGLALVELANEVVVLGRDGSLNSIDPRGRHPVRSLSGNYQPLTAAELRNQLRREFGRDFEVTATKNFLVVQPQGRGNRWPDLFEQSHREFVTYMSKRGVHVREGRFPMVAVVFPDQVAMYDEFKRQKIDVSRVAGLYSNNSNRVMTHDGGRLSSIAATVRHEAAHQSAFNSGVHSRVNDTPKWITEGIGQMFESAVMTRSGSHVRDRVNRDSMRFIQANYQGRHDTRLSESIIRLIEDDTMFADDNAVEAAYALSWAMMFYLAERQPQEFTKMLEHTARRPPFQAYQRADRVRDFERIVGVETFEFTKRVSWFLQSL